MRYDSYCADFGRLRADMAPTNGPAPSQSIETALTTLVFSGFDIPINTAAAVFVNDTLHGGLAGYGTGPGVLTNWIPSLTDSPPFDGAGGDVYDPIMHGSDASARVQCFIARTDVLNSLGLATDFTLDVTGLRIWLRAPPTMNMWNITARMIVPSLALGSFGADGENASYSGGRVLGVGTIAVLYGSSLVPDRNSLVQFVPVEFSLDRVVHWPQQIPVMCIEFSRSAVPASLSGALCEVFAPRAWADVISKRRCVLFGGDTESAGHHAARRSRCVFDVHAVDHVRNRDACGEGADANWRVTARDLSAQPIHGMACGRTCCALSHTGAQSIVMSVSLSLDGGFSWLAQSWNFTMYSNTIAVTRLNPLLGPTTGGTVVTMSLPKVDISMIRQNMDLLVVRWTISRSSSGGSDRSFFLRLRATIQQVCAAIMMLGVGAKYALCRAEVPPLLRLCRPRSTGHLEMWARRRQSLIYRSTESSLYITTSVAADLVLTTSSRFTCLLW